MCSLSVPIFIFQGEDDVNIPISDIDKIRADFDKAGNKNLRVFTFPNHSHDLNYLQYIFDGKISDGLICLFNTAKRFNKSLFNSEINEQNSPYVTVQIMLQKIPSHHILPLNSTNPHSLILLGLYGFVCFLYVLTSLYSS